MQSGGPGSANFWNDLNNAVQKGNIEEALKLAASSAPQFGYTAYQNVAMQVASSSGNIDAAREILNRAEIPESQREQMMEQTRRDIEAETRRAIAEIRREVADLTVMATEKVTRKALSDDDQRRLVEEALSELDFTVLSAGGEE